MTTLTRARIRRLVPVPLQPAARRAYLRIGPATSRLRMTPSFLVIGGQRCGTTTIFKTLSAHPQVMRPPVEKGTDYYTLWYDRGPSWYRGHFPMEGPSRLRTASVGAPVAFEACTYYLFHPLAMERIARDFPDIKLVVMLRDPVERAYSAYKHEHARGFDPEPEFSRAVDLEDERLSGEEERLVTDPGYHSFAHRHHAYLRRGQYVEQLERVFQHFPREQVHIMQSEAFFERPEREYAALTRFLGLSPWAPAHFDQHNARPSSPMDPDVHHRLTTHFRPYDEALADLLHTRPLWMPSATARET
jgi:hypothetical protein